MKSDHRHELKTNELADWLSNLPEWTRENLTTIILVVVLLGAAGGIYIWKNYHWNIAQNQQNVEFTGLLNQLAAGKLQIVEAQSQGKDESFMLLQPANSLETFAQHTRNDRMAALALIKRAEALRSELHYGTVQKEYLISQTNLAKASYEKAIEKCPDDPSLRAAAKFGTGLCEEELGNFDQARQIYQDVAAKSEFEDTVAAVQAKRRLAVMADYERQVVFKSKPAPPAAAAEPNAAPQAASAPVVQINPADVNAAVETKLPAAVNKPADANQPAEVNKPAQVNP